MDSEWFRAQDKSFFNSLNQTKTPNVILTAETEDFDEETTRQWVDEGFNVAYLPLLQGGNEYIERIHATGDAFGVSEYYAVLSATAFGDAASLILEGHLKPTHPKLCAIVAYYPSQLPSLHSKFPPSFKVLVHLADIEAGVTVKTHPQMLGISGGKAKIAKKHINPGAGYGEGLKISFPAYTYAGVASGFAERDLEEYDAVAESVAFSRSLNTVRKGFRIETDIETVRDDLVDLTAAGNADKAIQSMRPFAHVINGPTLTGGVGTKNLKRFYSDFFQPLPPTFRARLLSRTIGTDRICDELYISFTHTEEIPWILPEIPATNKKVEIAMVSIVRTMGERLESEHVYWDQASVLVQTGLLSAKMVPEAMKKKGVEELPVVGAEAARAMKRGSSKHLNELMSDWE
ncbi:hypothetical protein LTR85_010609 [Meristemomyces frigidus]|nr:hypothetical protein LTR85_010609 [Meristemomyces frigidus]